MSTPPPQAPQIVIDPEIAQHLEGITLPEGWQLTKRLRAFPNPTDQSGGFFSVGYLAQKNGEEAFVKVFDLGAALRMHSGNIMKAMMSLGQDHQYECHLLEICSAANLDRIVKVLARGQTDIKLPNGLPTPIPYIVFEYAEHDIRNALRKTASIEDAWRLRMLHQVAVGLQQLHSKDIAHQDLKPSNVLIFEKNDFGAKIADLGRASRGDGARANHDTLTIAGATDYAPPEQAYGVIASEWRDRREGCDIYHLGSLLAFVFAGVTPNSHYMKLPREILPPVWQGTWAGTYSDVLPLIGAAFSDYLRSIDGDLPSWAAKDLVEIIGQMCEPDYARRGHPDARAQTGSPIGLDRFISRLDVLAKSAVVKAKAT